MKEAIGIVENGQIKLKAPMQLPEGTTVRIIWDEDDRRVPGPFDREMLTEEDVKADLAWATGKRFAP